MVKDFPVVRRYLGRIQLTPEEAKALESPQVRVCRHCKRFVGEHAQSHCLFEATCWSPMNEAEMTDWFRASFHTMYTAK